MKIVAFRVFVSAFAAIVLTFGSGCTEPGETTAIGAASGGVVGAGLGAIVGNQTGNPGSGMTIGALAGAGTGAAIGNVFEAQDKKIEAQGEIIQHQDRQLARQQAELYELQRMSQDKVSFESKGWESREPEKREEARGGSRGITDFFRRSSSPPTPAAEAQPVARQEVEPRAGYDWGSTPEVPTVQGHTTATLSPECEQAEQEVIAAGQVSEIAEKLYHYRRAQRLCPTNPSYHNGLGEIYVSLDRREDAEYEFREALRLDPSYRPARSNLERLQSSSRF